MCLVNRDSFVSFFSVKTVNLFLLSCGTGQDLYLSCTVLKEGGAYRQLQSPTSWEYESCTQFDVSYRAHGLLPDTMCAAYQRFPHQEVLTGSKGACSVSKGEESTIAA